MRHGIVVFGAIAVVLLMTGTSMLPVVQSEAAGEPSLPDGGHENTARAVTQKIGPDGGSVLNLQISPDEGAAIHAALHTLEDALHHGDRQKAYAAASELIERGVFKDARIYSLIDHYCTRSGQSGSENNQCGDAINLMSLVLGSGDGIFIYTLDVLATFLIAVILLPIPFGIVLAIFYMYLWLVVSHAVPFRLVQPTTSFWLFNGSLNTVGLKGTRTLHADEDAPVNGSMLGFAGVIVNLMIPRENNNSVYYYFCMGSAVAVLPSILPLLSFFTTPARVTRTPVSPNVI